MKSNYKRVRAAALATLAAVAVGPLTGCDTIQSPDGQLRDNQPTEPFPSESVPDTLRPGAAALSNAESVALIEITPYGNEKTLGQSENYLMVLGGLSIPAAHTGPAKNAGAATGLADAEDDDNNNAAGGQ